MGSKKHRRKRDVPHAPRVRDLHGTWQPHPHRKRIMGASGSMPVNKEGSPPAAPPICLIYPDAAEGLAPAPVLGQYPVGLIAKILPWLRCERAEVLHVCSGSLPPGEGIRVDIRAAARPDILADGRDLPIGAGSVAAVMLDPPYSEQYAAQLYGVDYPRPSRLLAEASRVVRPCGRIAFVHYITPNPPDGCRFVKAFGLSMGFGFPMRAVTIYEREQASLFGEGPHGR